MSEDKKEDMIPDKSVYQTNRRRMAWLVMGMLLAMTIAIISVPDRDWETYLLFYLHS